MPSIIPSFRLSWLRSAFTGQRHRRGPNPRRLLAAVLAAAILFGVGYFAGWRQARSPEQTQELLLGSTNPAAAAYDPATALSGAAGDGAGSDAAGGGAASDAAGGAAGPRVDDTQSPYVLLLESVLPSGAIKVKPDDDRIIPYFANLAAMALLPGHALEVREYLQWYLAHLNGPDRFGIDGSIYDFLVDDDGLEQPTSRYDSADSYAATFLTLLRSYVDATGDLDFARANLADIRRVASVIPRLQDSDGLVWALASRREKYLMDNAEDFRGLNDYAAVLDELGLGPEAAEPRAAAGRVRNGVETRLWDAKRGSYDWGIYTLWLGGRRIAEWDRKSSWRNWYPDTVAQVFPVITGLLAPSDPRAVSLYENLNAWHPGWVNQAKRDPNPWSVLGYAAATMGDKDRALAFARATSIVYLGTKGPYTGLSWELAWHLLTLRLVSALPPG